MRYFLFLYIFVTVFSSSFLYQQEGCLSASEEKYELEQEGKERKEQKSWLVSFLEKKLSFSDRKISFSGIEIHGIWTIVISIPLVTIADKKGTWLKITNATVQLSPVSLLTGHPFLSSLQAERVTILRSPKPKKEEKNNTLKPSVFLNFPLLSFIMFHIHSVSIQKVVVGEHLLYRKAIFSFIGKTTFTDGIFGIKLFLERLDEEGGNLSLVVKYDQKKHNLDLDFNLAEPADGIINEILGVENAYPVNFSIKGNGYIENINLKLVSLSGKPQVRGVFSLQNEEKRRTFLLSIEGFSRFIPQKYQRFTGKNSTFTAQGTVMENLDIEIKKFVFDAPKDLASPERTPFFPLRLFGSGSCKNNILTVDNLTAEIAGEFLARVSGYIPFSGNGLDLAVYSVVPLHLVDYFFVNQNTQFTGQLVIDAHLSGSFSSLLPRGRFSLRDGRFFNFYSNLQFTEISLSGHFDNENLIFDQVTGKSAQGGTFSLYGSLIPNIQKGFPAQLVLRANRLQYNNGALFHALLEGNIEITGPLLYKPLFSGTVAIEKTEIDFLDKKKQTNLLEVQHVNLSPMIAQTLRRIKIEQEHFDSIRSEDKSSLFSPVFDLQINAPKRIFVRGQGVNAELGGCVRLNGELSNIRPVGNFEMIRGQFDILGRKLNFSKGKISLTGNFNPALNFVAETRSNDLHVILNVSGTLDALFINFNSRPELPQDEILSRLLFKRSLNELSAFQVALLLDAAAEITGITEKSLINNLRSGIGLDTLNIMAGPAGGMAIQAGRYIHDNIYIAFETGSTKHSRGTINFDINQNFKVKANVDTNVNSGIGLFFEKEY